MHRILLFALLLSAPAAADVHHVDFSPGPGNGSSALARVHATFWPTSVEGPARLVRVEIPRDARVTGVALSVTAERRVAALPAPPVSDPSRIVDVGSPATSPEGYRYWVLRETSFRGHRIANIAVSTHRESTDGAYLALASFSIDVTTAPGGTPAIGRMVHHERTDAADARALTLMLDSPPLDTDDTARAGGPFDQPVTPLEYVIVTDDEMAPAFQELADLKTREGMPAAVTTVSWILDSYDGIDTPARIRAYLRDLYLHRGLRYALLGGDAAEVPVRLAVNKFQSPGDGARLTADSYYACLDGDWNADGDAVLGEAPDILGGIDGDEVDLVADVSVARVPASTAAEAAAFVAKWKSYTGYDPANFRTDYQNRFLALAEVIFPSDWDITDGPDAIVEDGADISESTLVFVPESIERTRLYEYWEDPEHPGALPELKESVIAEINAGYGFIDHIGHGFRTNMSVGDDKLVNSDADAFTNTNAYSLLYGINCTSGAVLFDCIGEHLINNPTGGIVASISATDLDYPTASDVFKHEFFRLIFQEDVTRLSDAYHLADLPQVPLAMNGENVYRWTIMGLIAFGDPAMEIWRGTPRIATIDAPATFALGDGSVSVTVTEGGQPVPDATVCLAKTDAYAVGSTNAAGVATLSFAPATPGSVQVTVTKNTFVPVLDTMEVVTTSDPALLVSGVVFQDGTLSGGFGNGDGGADAGETILVDVVIRNAGGADALAADATLVVDSPHVEVTDAVATLPPLPAGAETTLPVAFAFDVDRVLPGALRRVIAGARITVSSADGEWVHEQPFAIRQRILDLSASHGDIVDDDGDGVFETGETMEIAVTLTNHGDATAVGVVGLASVQGTDHVLLDDTVDLGDIAPGASVESPPFRLLSTGGDAGYALSFFASDALRLAVLGRTLDGIAPAPPETLFAAPAASAVTISWPPATEPDVRGYRVYRSATPGGPYLSLGGITEGGSYFEDETVTPIEPYEYRVASVDWSGNESALSQTITATTSPPILEGWPVDLPSGVSKGSPTVADLDGDGELEIIFGWAHPMVLRANGGDFVDGDNEPLTVGVFSSVPGPGSQFWNSPAVADLDGDGVLEIVYAAWQTTGQAHLYVLDATGAVEPGWPQPVGLTPWSTAAVGDVDGAPGLEIFMSSGAGSGDYRGVLFGFHHDGSEIIDGDGDPATLGVFHVSASPDARFLYGSPALANLTGDSRNEVIFLEKTSHVVPTASTLFAFSGDGAILAGFPYGVGQLAGSTSCPAVADLDDDGTPEIIIVTDESIAVVRADGTDAPGWPIALPAVLSSERSIRDFLASPAVGDVDLDGALDVVLGWLDGEVLAWTGESGTPLPGFPAVLISASASFDRYLRSPVLGNVDGDPNPEILVSSGDGRLAAANHDGSVVAGFPLQVTGVINGSPLLWDVDGDGNMNLVIQSEARVLQVFDLSTVPFVPEENPWPMFRHDARKTGDVTTPIVPLVPRVASEVNGALDAATVGAPRPNPLGGGRVRVPFEVPRGGARVLVRVFDVTGRDVRVLADGRFPAGAFEIAWDGRTRTGSALAAGVYLLRVTIGEQTFGRKITLVR